MDKPDDWFTSNGAHIPIENGENKNESLEEHKENNKNPIIVKGDELGKNLSGKELRNKAEEYYKNNLANKTVKNEKLGTVKFSQGGFSKPISASGDERKLKLFPFLPDIISTGKVSDLKPDRYNRPNVKGFYTIRKTINFEGNECKVMVSIREDNNGKLYYDHAFIKDMQKGEDSAEYELNLIIE